MSGDASLANSRSNLVLDERQVCLSGSCGQLLPAGEVVCLPRRFKRLAIEPAEIRQRAEEATAKQQERAGAPFASAPKRRGFQAADPLVQVGNRIGRSLQPGKANALVMRRQQTHAARLPQRNGPLGRARLAPSEVLLLGLTAVNVTNAR
jgi:hypothetical protein